MKRVRKGLWKAATVAMLACGPAITVPVLATEPSAKPDTPKHIDCAASLVVAWQRSGHNQYKYYAELAIKTLAIQVMESADQSALNEEMAEAVSETTRRMNLWFARSDKLVFSTAETCIDENALTFAMVEQAEMIPDLTSAQQDQLFNRPE